MNTPTTQAPVKREPAGKSIACGRAARPRIEA
jgi:hypothetical protein